MLDVEQTIISQYANSPTIVRLINNMNAYLDPRKNIDNFFKLVWNVDTAIGYGLDLWGRIVGVSRVLQISDVTYFGFTGPFGASGVPWNQGIFYNGEPLTSNYTLSDSAFRILILAKALKNICNATIGATNQILINLFGANGLIPLPGNSYCTDGLDMTMTYTFHGPLDPVSSAIIYASGVLPRPAGVLSTVVVLTNADFWDDGGVLVLFATSGYPTSPGALSPGDIWSNGLVVSVVTGGSPVASPPIYFGSVTAAGLLALGGLVLPTSPGLTGSGQLWNNGGVVSIS